MIFGVLCIQLEYVELLHETNQLRSTEVPECVARQAQPKRRRGVRRWPFLREREDVFRRSERCRDECTRTYEIATREIIFHKRWSSHSFLNLYQGYGPHSFKLPAPNPSRTRVPTSSSRPGRPESCRRWCRVATPGSLPTRCWKAATS